jgi:hypothetical protein
MCLFLLRFRNLIHVPSLRASHDRFPLPSLLRQRAEKASKADPVRGALLLLDIRFGKRSLENAVASCSGRAK